MGIFDETAMRILRQRYLIKNHAGQVVEDVEGMLWRVARYVASVEQDKEYWQQRFFDIMAQNRFLPNSPTLANAGRPAGQLAACFVLPVPDSVEGIFEAIKKSAQIHKTGGGTGFSFSKIRPRGDLVSSTGGIASGPVPFISAFNCATDVIKQGGMRSGANMAVMDYWHPDIIEFIQAKTEEGKLTNFNFSVGVDEKFMCAVLANGFIDLVNPRTGTAAGTQAKASEIFNLIVRAAWQNGEPGLLFFDHINSRNTIPGLGNMSATNPCGEQPLFDYESCNLGSLNLVSYLSMDSTGSGKKGIDWPKLKDDIFTAVRFLDNVIDVNYYILPEVEIITRANRKIGLGVMGFADLLLEFGLPYDSGEALSLIDSLMANISKWANEASALLANEKGSFPNISKSIYQGISIRNATRLTIAPTGTISMLAGVSSGIEPMFGLSYIKEVLNGERFEVANSKFEEVARAEGFWSKELMDDVMGRGTLQGVTGIPEGIARVFKTAVEIAPEWHIRVQATFQKYVDNAVSKTVNLPNDATLDDISNAYLLAWKLGCKGITIYRSGSRGNQVLKLADQKSGNNRDAGGCRECTY